MTNPVADTPGTTPEAMYEKRLRAARWLSKQGFGIVLLPVPLNGDCQCPPKSTTRTNGGPCRSPGKHPLGQDWEHNAAHTSDEINALVPRAHLRLMRQFGVFPEIGSGLLVLDEDVIGKMQAICDSIGIDLPATFTVLTSVDPTTGERKRHKYWRIPAGYDPQSIPKTWIGGEVRVEGSGQVVGPWSMHLSGTLYEPEPGTPAEIAVIPAAFLDAMRKTTVERSKTQVENAAQVIHAGEGRHEFLVQSGRHLWKGGIRGEDLVTRLKALNQTRCNPPYPEPEMVRLADWCEKNLDEPWVPITLNVPGAPGYEGDVPPTKTLRVVRPDEFDYDLLGENPKVGEFPVRVDDEAFHGSTLAAIFSGEMAQITSASRVGLLASFLSIWSGMFGARFDLYEEQPTNLFCVLVGDTSSGRKGTTTRAVWSAFEQALNGSGHLMSTNLYDSRWDGLASGQGFMRQMADAKVKKGVAIEEEFENVLRGARSSANYASTLGTTIQKAFDGALLQHITVRGSLKVAPPYTVGILGNITREVLRTVMPVEFIQGGFANRMLYIPVREDPDVKPRGGRISPGLADAIREAVAYAQTDPDLIITDPARAMVQSYYEYLGSMTGTQALFVRRLHVIAARIAAIHALCDQERFIKPAHVLSGIAMTEYARRGLLWTFGRKTGDEWLDVVVSALRAAGDEGLPTRAVARLLQNHAPRIERTREVGTESGLLVTEKIASTGGRPSIVWRHAQTDPLKDYVRALRAREGASASERTVIEPSHSLGGTDESTLELEQTANNPLITNVQPSLNLLTGDDDGTA